MKKQSQSGFAIVELVVVVVIIAAIVVVGYFVWHEHNSNNAATKTTTASNYQSPPVTAPTAPQVNNASDLNGAMQALNQTNVTAGSIDSSQLSTQASGF